MAQSPEWRIKKGSNEIVSLFVVVLLFVDSLVASASDMLNDIVCEIWHQNTVMGMAMDVRSVKIHNYLQQRFV